jgi:predicted ribosome quality control (RQC) complex YloA/Tae2 family protein
MKKYTHQIGTQTFDIYVGTNAKENWDLIDKSEPDDLWFHLEDFPSSHVIVREKLSKISTETPNYPNQIISLAGDYCKTQSKYKQRDRLKIIYTLVSNIRKGRDIGSVIVSKSQYIFI